jgi:hypothetical protein
MSDLLKLAKPFPAKYVHDNPSGGGSYVKHHLITQKLLADLGAYQWEIVQVIRGYVDAKAPNPNGKSFKAKQGSPALEAAIVGCVGRLTVCVDGRTVTVDGAGDCEDPHNWPHDGARLKDAESDAKKRAALHLGVALHLWAQDEYILYDALVAREGEGS